MSEVKNITTNYCGRSTFIISGGGALGISAIGSFKAILDNTEMSHIITEATHFVGCSVGSILALMLALRVPITANSNKTFIEILEEDLVYGFDGKKICAPIKLDRLITDYGICDGSGVVEYVIDILKHANMSSDATLGDIHTLTGNIFCISTICVETGLEYFDSVNASSLPIVTAIRMSTAIPIFYTPVKHNCKHYIDAATNENPLPVGAPGVGDCYYGIQFLHKAKTTMKISSLQSFIMSMSRLNTKKHINLIDRVRVIVLKMPFHPLTVDLPMDIKKKIISLGNVQTNNWINLRLKKND